MRKFFVNLLCAFIPNADRRRDVRQRLTRDARPSVRRLVKNCQNDLINIRTMLENMASIQNQTMGTLNAMAGHVNNQNTSGPMATPAWINRIIEKKLSTALLHQKTFLPFQGVHADQDIVIVATGPSLNDFQPIDGAIYIGVNSAFLNNKIPLDYLFVQDYLGMQPYMDQMNKYRSGKCQKFYGLTTEFDGWFERVIPQSDAAAAGAYRYRTDWECIPGFEPQFAYDISVQSLGCFGSIVFPAIQFALWTNPRRIYLVGCDCNNLGHFDQSPQSEDLARLVEPWRQLRQFAKTYYPGTEIISVNPVGLRGMFTDLYQSKEN